MVQCDMFCIVRCHPLAQRVNQACFHIISWVLQTRTPKIILPSQLPSAETVPTQSGSDILSVASHTLQLWCLHSGLDIESHFESLLDPPACPRGPE